jgi:hypothetical protein
MSTGARRFTKLIRTLSVAALNQIETEATPPEPLPPATLAARVRVMDLARHMPKWKKTTRDLSGAPFPQPKKGNGGGGRKCAIHPPPPFSLRTWERSPRAKRERGTRGGWLSRSASFKII